MHPVSFLANKRVYQFFLIFLSLISIYLAWMTTSPFGAGIGTDGAFQLSAANNLLVGNGLVIYTGEAFTKWPPLYPLLLAGMKALSGVDTFTLGWYINLFTHGLIVWLSGMLLLKVFPNEISFAYMGSLVVATSMSLLSITANIGTDTLFSALILIYLLIAINYLEHPTIASLSGMALLGCLATMQRLPGAALVGATACFIIYIHRKRLLTGIFLAGLVSIATLIPLLWWVFIHNYVQNDTLFGIYLFKMTYPLVNLQNSLIKIVDWFIPYNLPGGISPLLLAGTLLLIIGFTSKRADWKRLYTRLQQPPALSSWVLVVMYLVLLILTINSVDTKYLFYDRYQIVILTPILVILLTIFDVLLLEKYTKRQKLVRYLLVGGFLIWLVYPIYNTQKFIRQSRAEGVISYNQYNTRVLHESELIRVLSSISDNMNQTLYSNYPAGVWFFTRRNVAESPRGTIIDELNIEELSASYEGWPWDKPGYLIWFLPNEYDHVLEPDILNKFADLRPIYQGREGRIYRVRSQSP